MFHDADECHVDFICKSRFVAHEVGVKNISQATPCCFSRPAKLLNLSLPVAWFGILQDPNLNFVIHLTTALALAINFIPKDLE